jgi:hypothetical protein
MRRRAQSRRSGLGRSHRARRDAAHRSGHSVREKPQRFYGLPLMPSHTFKRTWSADCADEQVQAMMSGHSTDESHVVTIAPQQMRTERLEGIEKQLRELPRRNLPEEEEDAARDALRAERRALREMNSVRQEIRKTGRTRTMPWTP